MHRDDFQIFKNYKDTNKSELIYLDNAASSLTPDTIVSVMNDYYFKYRSNIDRGLYKSATTSTEKYNEARQAVAKFINADGEELIFTSGSTDASNKLVRMLEQKINNEKDEIIIATWAHHSDLVPLQELAKRNNLKIIEASNEEDCIGKINNRTFIVSWPLVSNVTGNIFDIKKISNKKNEFDFYFISDMTAAVGHIEIGVKDLNVDAAYFAAHKMCGPTGVGALYIKRELLRGLQPVTFGGGMVWEVDAQSSSYRSDVRAHEAGTAGIAEVIGFGAAVDYITDKSIVKENNIKDLLEYAFIELNKIDELEIYSELESNSGIISFNIKNIHAHDVAEILSRHHVCVRSGHHCAQLAMKHLNVNATCRASFYFYNTKEDVNALVAAIKDCINIFKK